MVHDTFDPLLSEKEYRTWLGISAPTAQRQRSSGSGPPFVQLSQRRVGYRKSAVEQWLDANTINRVGALVKPTAQARVITKPPTHPTARAKRGLARTQGA